MSKRFNNGSHYENHPRAAELHELAAHNHGLGEHHEAGEHLTGAEHTRQAGEHKSHSQDGKTEVHTMGHGIPAFTHADTAVLAYQLWEARGRPEGSSGQDWQEATRELRTKGEELYRYLSDRSAKA